MKLKFLRFPIALLLSVLFISCETSDDLDENLTTVDVSEVKSTVANGSWIVSLYEEDAIDQTSNFSGFGFEFLADGSISVSDGSNSFSGAWSITSESSSSNDDSSSSDDIDFNIFFTSPVNFEEISEDWEIISYSSSRIELRHVSGGDGSIDRLIFEKI
ncbi:hypothetical protein ACOCEA_00650 [Maribacter sp. CXY002]|uniref:hypothetical protein n=1 Tax=Maribacter luteocoastalis TaxID=3407671 RepID=UPI003B66F1A5